MTDSAPSALRTALSKLGDGGSLSTAECMAAFTMIMHGEGSPVQTAALLMGLRVKGETAAELEGAAQALRGAMRVLDATDPARLVDTCGTGGGAFSTFNISTAAALLAAGAGVRIAKHGNRSFTSRCGSADVLEALGVDVALSVERMQEVLSQAGIVFMFAPTMHPAMRHVGPVRRELAVPTVMNLLGPLANPARAGRQVIGVADVARLPLIADALLSLGTTHAMVVHGSPGMDEISPIGPTRVIELQGGKQRPWRLDPDEYGFAAINPEDLAGGSPEENAVIIERVLVGKGTPGAEAAVLLNAAGAIHVSGVAADFSQSLHLAREALRGGAGYTALQRLRTAAPAT